MSRGRKGVLLKRGKGFPGGSDNIKNLTAMQETWVQSLGWEDPLEEGMVTQSIILAWRIPWTVACQAPLPMGFSWQEYWSWLLFPHPGYST